MGRVFMSHSKDDEAGRTFFAKFFDSSDHKAYWYSWEGPKPPHAKTILDALKASDSLFVVLSKPMEKTHTRTWVSYEVGLAAALKLNVWVFEPKDEKIDVPIPYVTGYIQYPKKVNTKKTFPFFPIVESAGTTIPTDQPEIMPKFKITHCGKETCKATFYRFVYGKKYKCPVCRGELIVSELDTSDIIYMFKDRAATFNDSLDDIIL
ncbi:Uncharacterised protein [uncultured archaeon]|nr:Uncharacterised protein [uncultured archaeon]